MSLFSKADSAELVVLSLLREGTSYGYQLTKDAAQRTDGGLRLTPGVLYPLLKSLETQGLIASHWEEIKSAQAEAGEAGRRRKWYRLTPKGSRRLSAAVAGHRAYFDMIRTFLGGAAAPDAKEPSP